MPRRLTKDHVIRKQLKSLVCELAWCLKNRHLFSVELQNAEKNILPDS